MAPHPPDAPISVEIEERTYPVVGSTEDILCSVVELLGPRRNGSSFIAFTDWEVHWTEAEALAHTFRVELRATIWMPAWAPPRSAAPSLVLQWTRLESAIREHERGHVEIGTAAARAVAAALSQLPPVERERLRSLATSTAKAALRPFLEREEEYDRATGHGKTQGVHLQRLGTPRLRGECLTK